MGRVKETTNGGIKSELSGSFQKMNEVFKRINQARQSHMTVLIRGESGTGKELFARTIHQNSSREQDKDKDKFIAINRVTIAPHLFENELFGYKMNQSENYIGPRF